MDKNALQNKIVEVLEAKKALDIKVVDIEKVTIIADRFVICTGTSKPHIKALVDELEEKLKELGVYPLRKEGYEACRWVLLDFGSIIVHIFHQDEREYYDLDKLWENEVLKQKEKGE